MAGTAMSLDLSTLNPEQRAAVLHGEGPALVVAGAGSGKTRVLTTRIARLVNDLKVPPDQILAITFTTKAAKEMRDRVAKLCGTELASQMWIMTFHSACLRILRRHPEEAGLQSASFSIYDEDDTEALLLDCIETLGLDSTEFKKGAARSIISRGKNAGEGPDSLTGENSNQKNRAWARVWALYDKRLAELNAVDFDDILLRTRKLLGTHPEVLELLHRTFVWLLVDEVQDTNRVQLDVVMLLGRKHRNVFVVGDSDQSIYRFRGADIQNILRFTKDHFPNGRTITLERNYRSTKPILDAANAVIANNDERPEKNLWTEREGGSLITRQTLEDPVEEAAWVAARVSSLIANGVRGGQIAVLCRRRQMGRDMEKALLSNEIPCRLVGTGTAFFERKDTRDALAYLKAMRNPADDLAFRRIMNTPRRGIGDSAVLQVREYATRQQLSLADAAGHASVIGLSPRATEGLSSLHAVLEHGRELIAHHTNPRKILEAVIEATDYRAYLDAGTAEQAEARLRMLDDLLDIAQSHHDVDALLETAGLTSDQDEIEADERVIISTVHAAKGLEWPVVFVPGMEEGVFPDERSSFGPELEEERRLCYVAITRARQRLYLSNALRRSTNGVWKDSEPSRFLDEIPPELFAPSKAPVRRVVTTSHPHSRSAPRRQVPAWVKRRQPTARASSRPAPKQRRPS